MQALTSVIVYRIDGSTAPGPATATGAGFILRGTAFESTIWVNNKAVQNLKVAATSGSTAHIMVQYLEKD